MLYGRHTPVHRTGSPTTGRLPWLIALGLCLCVWLSPAGARAAATSIQLGYQRVNNFPVKYVAANLNDPEVVVSIAVAQTFPTGTESWSSFIKRLQPDAAINGTYFSLRNFMPVGDVAIDGELLYKGVVGTALCISPTNQVAMLPGPQQGKTDWTGYRTVLCAGPRLLTNGQITLNARAEGFRDPRVLGSASRSAVAKTAKNVLLLLTVEQDISLQNLALVCLKLGATDAMALDGGSSSTLYADGRVVTGPGRSVSNIIVVYRSRERYQAVQNQMTPGGFQALAQLLPERLNPAIDPLKITPADLTLGMGDSVRTPTGNPTRDAGGVMLPRIAPIVLPVVRPYVRPQEEEPAAPTPPPAAEPLPTVPLESPFLMRFAPPGVPDDVQGIIPLIVEMGADPRVEQVTLRIDGQLRAVLRQARLDYRWDTTRETDGFHIIELAAWDTQQALLAREIRQLRVRNAQ